MSDEHHDAKGQPMNIAEGLPPAMLAHERGEEEDTPSIARKELTARQIFLAWEKLRFVYNLFLLWLVLGLMGWSALDFIPNLFEVAIIANICFCAGPVAEGYLACLRVPPFAARIAISILGTLLAGAYAVHVVDRIVRQVPVFPGFPG